MALKAQWQTRLSIRLDSTNDAWAFGFKKLIQFCGCAVRSCASLTISISGFNLSWSTSPSTASPVGIWSNWMKGVDAMGVVLSPLHAGCSWLGTPTLKELSRPSWLELRLRAQQFGHKMSSAAHISAAIWQQRSAARFVSLTAGSVAWIINNYLHVAPSNHHNNEAHPCLNACWGWGHFFLDQLHQPAGWMKRSGSSVKYVALQTASVAVNVPSLCTALQTQHLQCRMCAFSSTHLLPLSPQVEAVIAC